MKTVNILLLCFWCLVIFSFSCESAEKSSKTSYEFSDKVITSVEYVTKKDYDNESIIESSMSLTRKCAHFSLYFVLGILTINALKDYKIKKLIMYSIIFCFLYACSDEVHQLFSSGRTAEVSDVLIDVLGAITGIILYLFIHSKILRKSIYCRNFS